MNIIHGKARMNYGERLKYFRELKGLSGKALAERAGLVPSQVSKIESNITKPSLDSLSRLCDELGITLADFFSDTSPNERNSDISESTLTLAKEIETLSPQERKAVEAMLEVLKAKKEQAAATDRPKIRRGTKTNLPVNSLPKSNKKAVGNGET